MPIAAIPGIGGVQQAAIAAAFTAAGWTTRGTRRSPGAGHLVADLETGAGLAEAFLAADVVAFTLPQDYRPGAKARVARAIARAAADAGVGRIVLNTAARLQRGQTAAIFADMAEAVDLVQSGPVPVVVLEPTVFMDNLLAPWSLPGIQAGTLAYPVAETTRIAWMSHRTLAQAVVAAATADVAGQEIAIGGPQALSGADLTATLSARMGRPLAYAPIPLDGFAAGLNQAYGAPAGDRIAEMYRHLQSHPDSNADGAQGLARLGVAPESFADFVARGPFAQVA